MSEFSRYLLCRPDTEPQKWLAARRATGLLIEGAGQWNVLVPIAADLPDLLRDANLTLLLDYDYAEDHGFELAAFAFGRRVARLTARSEVGCRSSFAAPDWVRAGLLTAEEAATLHRRLREGGWRHEEIRDLVVQLLEFEPPAFLSSESLFEDREDLLERFPEAAFFDEGRLVKRSSDDTSMEVEAILAAERLTPPLARRTRRRSASASPELLELSRTFASAMEPQRLPAADQNDVDLAAAKSASSWLALRRSIDPAQASSSLLLELERTMREGRFPDEGERALVVREAAAMLLGRCIAAQQRATGKLWLAKRKDAAGSADERSAWEIAEARYQTAMLTGPATRDGGRR